MPLVAPLTFRVSMNGTYDSQPIAHVLDFVWSGISGPQPTRAQQGNEICTILGAAWKDTLDQSQSNLIVYNGCTWVDLDSETGATGVYNGGPFPIVGVNTAQPWPGNVAVRLIKTSIGPRGSRRGSIYLPGGTEALTPASSANTMSGAAYDSLVSRVATFYTDLTATFANSATGSSRVNLVITRTRELEYLQTSSVTGLAVQTRVASQRRRLDLT